MSGRGSAARLVGRREECDALDRLLGRVRTGQSSVLVMRGEAGIGKTALLEYLVDRAAGCRIARVVGVQSELELPFAGLHQLCGPLLNRLDRLPTPQRDALRTALGLSTGNPPDRFMVGLAVLSLVAEVAAERPLVCVVDDAQWIDQVSAQTLAFVARRLLAERIGLVLAVRSVVGQAEDDPTALAGLPELEIRGLRGEDARSLLGTAIPGPLDDRVRDRVVEETRGNPLALVELTRGFAAGELAGGFASPDTGPLASQIERSYVRRMQSLPAPTQRLLLTAAAEPVGDAFLLMRAADRLGIGVEAAAAAEAAGLIDLGARVRFRHPLVRSAAYQAAHPEQRRDVHRALAEATDPDADPDRRAWHRAQATIGPDETVAAELEDSAGRAQARGGIAAAGAFLQRATELTPEPGRRATRALAAAEAKLRAGAADAAYGLLAAAEIGPLDDLQSARLARLRARLAFASRRGNDSPPLLLAAAKLLEPLDGELAREAYLEALGAAIFAGRLGSHRELQEAARAGRVAPPAPQPPRATDLLLDGVAIRFTEGYAAGAAPLRCALRALRQESGRSGSDGKVMPWLWMACPVAPEPVAPELWDDETWHQLATRAVQLARGAGALAALPVALVYLAGVRVHAGELAAAAALIEEADAISEATGSTPLRYSTLLLAAWRGDEHEAPTMIDNGVRDATSRGEGRAIGLAGLATAVLYNGLGRYEAALAGARLACEKEDLGFFGWSLVELVEAAARSGNHQAAAEGRSQLEQRTVASGTDWALGMLARSNALLRDGQDADASYREAIERLERSRIVVHLARAHLLYGEWLRRERRRSDARDQLRIAYEMLNQFGAKAFAERARHELEATGETVHQTTTPAPDTLTAQEAQIARLAGGGLTNPQIGAQLFLSPHTVEWHLRKVFTKLGISSRRRLRDMLPDLADIGTPG